MAEIELVKLGKTFGSTTAVDAVDLRVAAGERMVIVGPSGCGKSTMLRLIAGLETPSAGEVRIGGRSQAGVPAQARDVAMVFQNYALYPHLTVRKNLEFALKMRKTAAAERRQRVSAVAARLGLTEQLERLPGTLSGGQQQRVALGRALARRPRAYLMDEPLANLDPRLRDAMRVELVRLHEQHPATMLYVTHDQTEAMMIGQRVAVLDEGRLLQVATPEQLYHFPNQRRVASLFGSPPMQFFAAEREGATLRSGSVVWPLPASSCDQRSPVVVGVRPEAFRAASGETPHRNGTAVVHGQVRWQQWLGSTRLLHVQVQDHQEVMMLADAEEVFRTGDPITRSVAANQLHLFSATTGERLQPAA